jgi:hypothetical protein
MDLWLVKAILCWTASGLDGLPTEFLLLRVVKELKKTLDRMIVSIQMA